MSPLAVRQALSALPVESIVNVATRERWQWLSPRGTTWELTQFVNNLEVTRGMTGRNSPPNVINSTVVPLTAGAVVTDIRHGVRELDVPLAAVGNSASDLRTLLANIGRDFDPLQGPGILRHINLDGSQADLFCYCVSGPQTTNQGSSGPYLHRETLIFQAFDPYWYQEPYMVRFLNSGGNSMFPILPLVLAPSNVLGDSIFENTGDVEAYPVWVINGPGSSATLTNNDLQQSITLVKDLTSEQQVTIDTQTGKITGPGGANWRRYVPVRQLWTLQSGINHINLSMVGADSTSYITMTYRPRTLAP